MKKMKYLLLGLVFCFGISEATAQEITQTIRGTLVDKESRMPLIGASVILKYRLRK